MENYNLFDSRGKKIDSKEAKRYNAFLQKEHVRRHGRDPELETAVKGILFDVLKNIFTEYAEKAGIRAGEMNFLEAGDIFNAKESDYLLGNYRTMGNFINISYKNIQRRSLEVGCEPRLMLLEAVCHEEAHAVSRNECRGVKMREWEVVFDRLRKRLQKNARIDEEVEISGYSLSKRNEPFDLFALFNEGVVEKLAREIFVKYLK